MVNVTEPDILPSDSMPKGLYKNLLGIIETLSFSIEDNTTWSNFDSNMEGDFSKNELYPSIISVNVGMKIIENHKVDKGTVTKYKYNFFCKSII